MVFEQFLSFWLVWMIVIIVAFFMDYGKKRSFLLIWILLMLFISQTHFTIGSIQISFAFIILLIGAIILFVQNSFSTYKLVATFCVMISYVSLLIWEKITPIWFFMPSFFLIPVIIVMLVTLLVHFFYSQITVAIVGISFGQIIFELLLIVYRLYDVVGEEVFLIHISLTILILIALRFIHLTLNRLSKLLSEN